MMLTGQSDVCTKNSVLLPVAYRTQFKILTVTFKALYLILESNSEVPRYVLGEKRYNFI